jgi:hypothetical protein
MVSLLMVSKLITHFLQLIVVRQSQRHIISTRIVGNLSRERVLLLRLIVRKSIKRSRHIVKSVV